MFHIHNGDATAEKAKRSTLPGEHFAFREALVEGPTPIVNDSATWRETRTRHLSEAYGVDLNQCERQLEEQEQKLAGFDLHDEVILWFEHDLFCQINLLYLLDWFSQRQLGETRLSLVCIDRFPGVPDFRGLGQLNPEQLASLFADRKTIERHTLELGSLAWRAYCSPSPILIEQLLQTDTSALPFLDAALRAHLERFPSLRNGLGALENLCIELMRSGLNNFTNLFFRFADALPGYGFGDAQFALVLSRLISANHPALKITGANGSNQTLALSTLQTSKVEITDLGRALQQSEADFISLNGIDTWLGGVHLNDADSVWRWDDHSKGIVSRATH